MRLNPLDPNSPDLAPARGDGVSEPLVLPEVVTRSTRPIELDPALDAPVVEQIALRGPSHSSGKYLVVDENTLVYRIDGMPNWFGVLAAGKGSLHPEDRGPSHLIPASSYSVRPANADDFRRFNRQVPPDFAEEPSSCPVVRALTPMYFVENDNLSDDWLVFKTEHEARAWVRECCQEIADACVDESGVGTGPRFMGMSRDEITEDLFIENVDSIEMRLVGVTPTRHWDLSQAPRTPMDAHLWAREIVENRDWAVFDTETTGLNAPRPVQIALVSGAGEILQYEVVNPGKPIDPAATAVHGKTDAEVASAPDWQEGRARFLAAAEGRVLVAYSAPYDVGVLDLDKENLVIVDAMTAYTTYAAKPKDQKLIFAVEQMGLPDVVGAHDALIDSIATRDLVRAMAAKPPALGAQEYYAVQGKDGIVFQGNMGTLRVPKSVEERIFDRNQLGEKGLKRLNEGYPVRVSVDLREDLS